MRFKTISQFMFVSALTLGFTAATAVSVDAARPDRRQVRQTGRIHQGVQSGALTQKETKRLAHGQAKVQRQKRRARADGQVTRQERRRIERSQDRQSRRVFRAKHNGRTRP